jgi:hypothetical protein
MKRESMDMGGRRATRSRGRGTRPAKSQATRSSRSGRARKPAASKATGKAGAKRSTSAARRAQPRKSRGAQVTTDLDEIRRWAESRGGKPVSVKGTARRGGAGLLRIDFPGYTGAGRFEEISWDEWYEKFQESNLEFLYQDRAANGGQSRFFKLVCRGTVAQKQKGRSGSTASRGSSGSRASAKGGTRSRSRRR